MWDVLGDKLLITVDLFKSWVELDTASKIAIPRDTDLVTKGDYLMRFMRRKSKSLADVVIFTPNELSVGFCANKNELLFCLQYLVGKGLIEEETTHKQAGGFTYRLTPAGWATLDTPTLADKPQAVVALIPGKDGDLFWTQGISVALAAAGLTAVRVDTKESGNKVTDELIVARSKARCVVADLTGQNPLVHFQAGVALGLRKSLFYFCEAS